MAQAPGKFDTVFLVGTGSELGAWKPLIGALNQVLHPRYPRLDENDSDLANWVLAQHVHNIRALHSDEFKRRIGKKKWEGAIKRERDQDRVLKEAIRDHFTRAVEANEVTLQPRFVEIVREARWGRRRFLTANWDHALPRFLAKEPLREGEELNKMIFPIHGARWPNGILTEDVHLPVLLPLETQIDPHHDKKTREAMRLSLGTLWQSINECSRLCIYGLSLDPLDAELAAMVRTGLDGAKCEIWIMNLAEEETRLRTRVAHLLTNPLQIHYEATGSRRSPLDRRASSAP